MLKPTELALLKAVHTLGTVTAAAEAVGMSQPAASAMLRHMEDRLGFDLFTRERRRLTLTRNGQAMLPEVLNALAGLEAVDRLSQDLKRGLTSRLVVGTVSTAAISLLPSAIEWIQARHPGMTVLLRAGNALDIIDMAADQRIDVGVILGSPMGDRVGTKLLAPLSLCCVMRPDHPLARRKKIGLADLAAARLIVLSPHLRVGESFSRAMKHAGLDFTPSIEVMQSSAACALVEANAGIAVLENLSAVHAQRCGLIAKPLLAVDDLPLCAVWPQNRSFNTPTEDLLARLATDAINLPL